VSRVDCPAFTFLLDSLIVGFPFLFFCLGGVCVWKQTVPKFLTYSPKEFPITPYFYPTCFGKCWPPFIYIGGPKGRNSVLQNRTFYLTASIVSFEFNITSVGDRHLPVGWHIVLFLFCQVSKPSKCAYKGIDDNNARFTNFDRNRN
jgi:hypothetical protein